MAEFFATANNCIPPVQRVISSRLGLREGGIEANRAIEGELAWNNIAEQCPFKKRCEGPHPWYAFNAFCISPFSFHFSLPPAEAKIASSKKVSP